MTTVEKQIHHYWAGIHSRQIEQRIVIEGRLTLLSPAHFGTGDSDNLTDMALLTDSFNESRPLLTGTTLAGALRAYLHSRETANRSQSNQRGGLTETLFGGFKGDDDGEQSALIVEDSVGESPGIELREGVKLNPKSRTAADKGLYNVHLWRAGTSFWLRFELLLTRPRHLSLKKQEAYQQKLRLALYTALQGLGDDDITLGSRKSRGFGQIKVAAWRGKAYDLRDAGQLCDWLAHGHLPLDEMPAFSLADFLQVNPGDAPDNRR